MHCGLDELVLSFKCVDNQEVRGVNEIAVALIGLAGSVVVALLSLAGVVYTGKQNRADMAQKVAAIMERHFRQHGIEFESYVVKVSNKGARLIA